MSLKRFGVITHFDIMEDAIATATAATSRSNNIMEDNPEICKKLSTMVSNFSVDDVWKN